MGEWPSLQLPSFDQDPGLVTHVLLFYTHYIIEYTQRGKNVKPLHIERGKKTSIDINTISCKKLLCGVTVIFML